MVEKLSLAQGVKSHKSLRQVLLILVLFSISFPALISGGILISNDFKRVLAEETQSKVDNYINVLAAVMSLPLQDQSPNMGQALIDVISLDDSVFSIVVKTSTLDTFLSYGAPESADGSDVIIASRDIWHEGQSLGRVTLVYSVVEAMIAAQSRSRLLLSILTIQLLFTVALVGYFLRKRVTLPLLQLERSAAGLAEGDLDVNIPQLGDDDFGSFANQLEHMRAAHIDSIHSLNQSIYGLEERVKEVKGMCEGT